MKIGFQIACAAPCCMLLERCELGGMATRRCVAMGIRLAENMATQQRAAMPPYPGARLMRVERR